MGWSRVIVFMACGAIGVLAPGCSSSGTCDPLGGGEVVFDEGAGGAGWEGDPNFWSGCRPNNPCDTNNWACQDRCEQHYPGHGKVAMLNQCLECCRQERDKCAPNNPSNFDVCQ